MIEAVAWASIAAVCLVFIGYPLAVILLSRLWPQRPYHRDGQCAVSPDLTVLICAHNEERHLIAKLDSVLAAARHYGGGVNIIVSDDGSTDRTPGIATSYQARGITPLILPRGGKAAALNAAAPLASGEIMVLTDADTLFEQSTLTELVRPFQDAKVGAVAGNVLPLIRRHGATQGESADGVFRRYESAIRIAEDRLFGTISADGGLYAVRRALMPHVPADGTDDFHISTAAPAAGLRIAFAPGACVSELPSTSGRKSLRRRVRITVRGLTALFRRRALMNPLRYGGYALGLVMHKLARRFAPLLLLPFIVCSFVLAGRGDAVWLGISAGIVAAVAFIVLGWLAEPLLPKAARAPYLASLHLFGLGLGVVYFLLGKRFAQWTPTSGQ